MSVYPSVDSNLKHHSAHCCLILDHVDMDNLQLLATFLRIVKQLQQSLTIAVVVITTSSEKPKPESIEFLLKVGKIVIPKSSVRFIDVTPLKEVSFVT